MSGIIERIRIFPVKGTDGIELSEASLLENVGLEGDRHAKGGEKQISLFFMENREKIDVAEQGLCGSRFRENITIRGLGRAEPGMRLHVGDAVLEISGEAKHCHDECPLVKAGKPCILAGKYLFVKVVKNGDICIGDKIDALL